MVPWSSIPKGQQGCLSGLSHTRVGLVDKVTYPQGPQRVAYESKSNEGWPDLSTNHTHFFFASDRDIPISTATRIPELEFAEQLKMCKEADLIAAVRLRKNLEDALRGDTKYVGVALTLLLLLAARRSLRLGFC